MVQIFVYNNGRCTVATAQRCGHTAMGPYFGLKFNSVYDTLENWSKSGNQKIIVLRHPIERFWSALGMYNRYHGESVAAYDRNSDIEEATDYHWNTFHRSRSREDTKRLVTKFVGTDPIDRKHQRDNFIYGWHSNPYMKPLHSVDFKYIDFNRLEEYIPKFGLVTNSARRDLDDTFEDDNGFYTREEMYAEVNDYNRLLSTKTEITVDEWQHLTQ